MCTKIINDASYLHSHFTQDRRPIILNVFAGLLFIVVIGLGGAGFGHFSVNKTTGALYPNQDIETVAAQVTAAEAKTISEAVRSLSNEAAFRAHGDLAYVNDAITAMATIGTGVAR